MLFDAHSCKKKEGFWKRLWRHWNIFIELMKHAKPEK